MDRQLILDTDGGVDDAQALLMLLAAGRAPDVITTVFGNVDLDQATRNILATLAVGGRPDVPVHMGAERPLVQPYRDATEIHGADGLGGVVRPEATPDPAGTDALGVIVSMLRGAAQTGGKIDLLMIGPLTNLAMALRAAPDCAAGIGQVTIMGGSIHGRGNVTPAAEFNIFSDPEAAAIVFGAKIDITLVPWEVCLAQRVPGSTVDAMFDGPQRGPAVAFSKALADHARSVIAGFSGEDRFRYVDTLAAAVVIDAGLVRKTLRASVDVALAPGITRGMTVVDPSGRLGTPMCTIVEEADLEGVTALYQASISGHAPP